MRSTSIDALHQECGELPLQIRRKKLLLRYCSKLTATKNNPASEILLDTWHNHYGKFTSGQESIYVQTKDYLPTLQQSPSIINLSEPWKRAEIQVDTYLQEILNKLDSKDLKKKVTLDYLQKYKDHLHVFTDASKASIPNLNTGASYCIPEIAVEKSFSLQNKTISQFSQRNY
jgi:hypothetical protein